MQSYCLKSFDFPIAARPESVSFLTAICQWLQFLFHKEQHIILFIHIQLRLMLLNVRKQVLTYIIVTSTSQPPPQKIHIPWNPITPLIRCKHAVWKWDDNQIINVHVVKCVNEALTGWVFVEQQAALRQLFSPQHAWHKTGTSICKTGQIPDTRR